MDNFRTSALFWDYENVPLRNKDYEEFLHAMNVMFNSITFEFIRIYAREQTMSDSDFEILQNSGFDSNTDFLWVSSDDPNAADFSMMQSCFDVLNTRKNISQVVLITGDGDFQWLVNQLPDYRVIVICQKNNYSKALVGLVDEAYSVEMLVANPNSWFYGY